MSVEIKGQQIKRACASLREMSADSSAILSSCFATKSRRRINGSGFAHATVQEETSGHGDQGGKENEEKREKMEGSTVAPNKNGGWDREFVYECDDDRVPSNFEFRPLFDLFDESSVCDTDFFFPSVVTPFFSDFFLPGFCWHCHCRPVPTDRC